MREAASRFLPKHTAAAAWKQRNLSHVEQEGLPPMPKDRVAEQGEVDGPLECSLALGMVAAETRRRVAAQQASGSLPWTGVDAEHAVTLQENCQLPAGRPRETHLVPMSPSTCFRKMEAWRTCGTWTTVTFCATQSWCRPSYRNSTSPTPKSCERSGITQSSTA